ncbi:zinc chelation protein SecC, partial [Butyricicoccus sp. 1XD8-22]
RGHTPEELSRIDKQHASPIQALPLRVISRGKVGRNDPCPCGSGLKFKKCCGK